VRKKKRSVHRGLEAWQGIAQVAMMVTGPLGVMAGCYYFFGRPEQVVQTKMGSIAVTAEPPGALFAGGMAVFGLVIFAIALIAYAATTVLIRRAKE